MADSVHHLTHDDEDSLRLLRFELALLESLFPPGWFSRPSPGHLAYDRWSLLNEMLRKRGMFYDPMDAEDTMLRLCRSLLDAHLLSSLVGGDLQRRNLGDLAGYGNEKVQKSIRTRVKNPSQFEDVMTELAFAGWHMSEGHSVKPSQEDSQADLTIHAGPLPLPLVVDCKHLESTKQRRPKDLIHKANTQIKAAGHPCYGVAAIDLSERVPVRPVTSDELPSEVTEVVAALHGSMVGPRNRSVSVAIVTWDDVVIQQKPPKTWYRLRRRCHILHHEQPREQLPKEGPVFRGFEVVRSVLWDYPRAGPRLFYPTMQAKMLCRELSLDMQRVAQAIMDRDETHTIAEIEGGKVSLFLRQSDPGQLPILACANERPSHSELLFAIPIPRKLIPEPPNPLSVLERVTSDFGTIMRLGGEEATLFVSREVSGPQTPLPIARPQDEPLFPFWLGGEKRRGEEVLSRVFLAFCLAVGRYRRWLDLNKER